MYTNKIFAEAGFDEYDATIASTIVYVVQFVFACGGVSEGGYRHYFFVGNRKVGNFCNPTVNHLCSDFFQATCAADTVHVCHKFNKVEKLP